MRIIPVSKLADENKLKEIHNEFAHFRVTRLVHDTNKESFSNIMDQKLLKPGIREYPGLGKLRLCFFGLDLCVENETSEVAENVMRKKNI